MNRLKLFLTSLLLLTVSNSFAVIKDGVRQRPEPKSSEMLGFKVSTDLETYYYLYNVNAKAFYYQGNDYNTRSSIDYEHGLRVAFLADPDNADTYFFYDYYNNWEWRMTFIDSKNAMYVDYNQQANYRWGVEKSGKTFRIFASPNGNPGWDDYFGNHTDCYEAGRYIGAQSQSGSTIVYPFLPAKNGNDIDWCLLSEDSYNNLWYQRYIYERAEELRWAIYEAETEYGIDVTEEKNIYLNESADLQTLVQAYNSVREKITDWKNSQASSATLDKPADMTFKISNPSFDGNDRWTGWSGTEFGAYNPAENVEHYNKTYNTYQTIEGLPKGIYAVGVKAFYRAGNASYSFDHYKADDEASHYAKLYALSETATNTEAIMSPWAVKNEQLARVGEESSCTDWELSKTFYIPNNMVAAEYYMHTLGYYENRVLIPVDESGTLTIGVKKEQTINEDWTIFDDFTLTFYGDGQDAHDYYTSLNTPVTSLVLLPKKTALIVGETMQITATVKPDNAKNKVLKWSSNAPEVATVNQEGLVTAVKAGSVIISAETTDGSNIKKTVALTVKSTVIDEGSLVINEIMASNIDEFVSPAFNFDGWMELYNTSNSSLSLSGLYVSDDATNLKKWRMPLSVGSIDAKGFKVIWFDSNNIAPQNAPFKLDVDGGTLYLSDTNGKLLASQTYPAAKERISYARTTDGGETWGLAVKATPGKSNALTTYATEQLKAPVVDQPSQVFSGQLSINVTVPSGCMLAFTTDGSLPTLDGPVVYASGQFGCSTTTNYRFRLYADGKLPSPVVTRSYIFRDKDYYLPIVSVVGDDAHLYGDDMGVLVQGNGNGRPGNGQSQPCNWNMDWERPVNFSYITPDGEMVLNQDVDLEMCGGWSRAWTPHAFKLKGNKEMGGNKHLPYPFFDEKPYIRNRTLQIRNGGNDTQARFKDPAIQQVVRRSGVDIDYQSYQPVHEFVNGNYIGVMNVREPNNKHFVYANYGWDDDEIDQFEMSPDSGYVQKCGTPDAFNELVDVLSPEAANSETYAEICKRLDIDEYINYMAAQLYLGNWDWPQNNVKAFRQCDGGKFRFVLFDLDGAFNSSDPFNLFMGKETYRFDQLYPTYLGRITQQIRFVTLFKNLLKNASFRRQFIDAYCIMGGSVFEASRAESIINELQERVKPAMRMEGKEWSLNSTADNLCNGFSGRNATLINSMKNYGMMELSDITPQSVNLSSNAEGAQLLVNGQRIPTGDFNGYLFAPATLKAVAPAGYAFQGWLSPRVSSHTLFDKGARWSYYDQGSLDGQNWQSPTYNESGWQKGNAPLGFGKDYIATTTDYGSDANNKRPTTYFRTTVDLTQTPTENDQFLLDCTIDDAAIVYVNGMKAATYNISASYVDFNTYADHYAYNNPDAATLRLDAMLFHKGSNVIAVEVHNCDNHSTDLVWDASLTTTMSTSSQDFYSTDAEISLPQGDNVTLTANYRELTQAEKKEKDITPVRINELSGSNNSLINEYQKKADWVELYNTTDAEVDVEGMYLTDDIENPEKYKITKGGTNANTKIPAHGFLIIWCDKQATTNQALHASFKISGEGGLILLTAADKSWNDIIYYEAHDANTTVGRYPDGTADVYAMNVTTISAPNILTSYLVVVPQGKKPVGISTPDIAAANGFRIHYGAQQLLIKSEDADCATVNIYTTDGRMVESSSVNLQNGTARLSVAHLPAGFYVARATDGDGNRVGCKFMK